MPHETAAVSVQVLCTPYNHATCHIIIAVVTVIVVVAAAAAAAISAF